LQERKMGELLDALKSAETGANASTKSALDQAADLFRAASQRVNEAIDAVREPGMP
jgi:vacuolar-type H+-ATPase subunit H